MKKRIMSLLMALSLCLSLLPTMALAGKVPTYSATEKTISKNQDGKCTVTLKSTVDEEHTYIWNFTLNSDSYVSGQEYSDFTDETASIEGTGKDETFYSASITITDVDNAPVMIVALIKTGETGNVVYNVQWTLDLEYEGITFELWPDTTHLPNKAGNYYLLGDVTLTDTWSPKAGSEGNPAITNLCLNGHVVNKTTGTGSVIDVPSGATLNLYDCSTDRNAFTYSKTGAWTYVPETDGSVDVITVDEITDETQDGAYVVVEGGCITGGKRTEQVYDFNGGGGVRVIAGGSFNMHGGNIVGNRTSSSGGPGGGVCVYGSFTMDGGSIIGNYLDNTNANGAGVSIRGTASFNMSGGNISFNLTKGSGGGVWASGSTFTMTGGTISDNTTGTSKYGGGVHLSSGGTLDLSGGTISDNTAGAGGGVYIQYANVYTNIGHMTMSGGTITGNKATNSNMSYGGGGVYAGSKDFKMTGGVISGNTTAYRGGGVFVNGTGQDGGITLGGTARITGNTAGAVDAKTTNNLYLPDDERNGTVILGTDDDAPENGMLVGVTPARELYRYPAIVKSGATADDVKYFFSDNAGGYVNFSSNKLQLSSVGSKKVVAVSPCEHGVVYTDKQAAGSGDTVTLTVVPDDGYVLKSLKYNDGSDHDIVTDTEGKYKFTMPTGKNVTVTAEFVFVKVYPIWIGYFDQDNPGVQVTAGDVLGDGTVTYTPDAEHPDTKGTLTLNNAKIATGDAVTAGIFVDYSNSTFTELTIKLVGDNQIGKNVTYNPEETTSDAYNVGSGVSADGGNVIFTGAGKLTIYDQYRGIGAPTTLSFGTETQSFTGTVDIESYPSEPMGAITAGAGGVTINGGTVDVTCYGENGDSIVAYGDVTISGGTVNAASNGAGIYSQGNLTITGGEVKATGYNGIDASEGGGDVTISGGTVDVTAGAYGILSQSDVTINGGEVDVTANGYGINAANVTIGRDDTKVTIDSQQFGIGATNVTIGGENTIVKINEVQKYGIYVNGDVTISGGTVNTAGKDNGIDAEYGTVAISGGTVTATGENVGILAKNVSITGGNVTGNGGIMAYYGALSITGGTVKADGECAIVGYGSISGPQADALTIGSEAAPLKIKNAMRMYLDGGNGFKDDEAITEAKGALALPVTDVDGLYAAALRALDNTGYVTIGEVEQPAPSSGGDYTPTVTIPVAGDKDSVKVQATVSGSTAKIKNVTAEQLDKVGTGKEVTVDLSSLNKSVTGVTFPKTTLENIAESEASGLEVKLPGGTTAVFDKTTVAAIAEQAEGNDIQLVIDTTLKAAQVLTGAQKSAIQGMKSALVLEAYFTSNGKRISNFKGGEAELTVSYPTTKPVRVWYLTEEGALEEVPSSFDGKSASFVVKHFSNYVIEQLDGSSYASCPQDATCVYAKFTDANTRAWYHDGVHYCVENGMMNGVGNDLFAPGATLTRGMVVTMLARLSGVDTATNGVWYVPGQEWAVANGISDGTNMTANITREQLATMLYRYALLKGVDTAKFTENTNTLSYDDVFTISDWAASGMHFCIAAGVVNGDNGMLYPTNTATRAEAATMFQRLGEKVLAK